ncbi:MAG: hypothetical protein WC389_20700 [Lutibacter sp.]|jgi:hypothetical protein
MKKLYEVTKTYYVMALSEGEAERIEPETEFCSTDAEEVGKDDFIDPIWRDAIPFNADDDKTVEQIQEEMED